MAGEWDVIGERQASTAPAPAPGAWDVVGEAPERRRGKREDIDWDKVRAETPPPVPEAYGQPEEKPSYLGNLGLGIVERGARLAGGAVRFVGQTADDLADWLEERVPLGGVEVGPDGIRWRASTPEDIGRESPLLPTARSLEGARTGYTPGTTWEDVKKAPLSSFLPFALEQGIVSVPDMAAVMLSLPAYVAARTGEIGQERATNDQRQDATVGDFMAAAPAAVGSALLERLGTRGVLGLDDAVRTVRDIPGAVGRAAVKEAGTEAGQEAVEYTGETLGTRKGFDPAAMGERALAGAVAGGPFGGSVRAVTGTVQAATAGPEQAAPVPAVPEGAVPAEVLLGAPAETPAPAAATPAAAPNLRAELEQVINTDRPVEEIVGAPGEWDVVATSEVAAAPEPPVARTFLDDLDQPLDDVFPEPAQTAEAFIAPEPIQDAALPGGGSPVESADTPPADGMRPPPVEPAAAPPETAVVLPENAGTRAAPVSITSAADIEAASRHAATSPENALPEPSEAQKEAGNYKKAHVRWSGLEIAIENPAGSTRSGTGPDGTAWSVEMPAAYGYVKGTKARDGDQVDVYMGPNPQAPRVYVVDQIDPTTGRFDEHKALIGFSSPEEALATYDAGFSDGSGPQRRGAVTTMPVQQFKGWVRNGNTKKPLRYVPQPAADWEGRYPDAVRLVRTTKTPLNPVMLGRALGVTPETGARLLQALAGKGVVWQRKGGGYQRKPYTGPLDLIHFLMARGGLRDDEGHRLLKGRDAQRTHPRYGALIRSKPGQGMSIDAAGEALWEAGYFGPPATTERPSVAQVLAKLDDSLAGRRVYSAFDQSELDAMDEAGRRAAAEAVANDVRDELRGIADEHGFSLHPDEIEEALRISLTEGVPPLDAVVEAMERAAIQQDRPLARPAPADDIEAGAEEIPFDDEGRGADGAGAAVARPGQQRGGAEGAATPGSTPAGGQPGARDQGAPAAPRAAERAVETKTPAREAGVSNSGPATERTAQGEQILIDGVRPVTDRDRAEAGMAKPLQPKKAQKPGDDGLFDISGRGQQSLFQARQKGVPVPDWFHGWLGIENKPIQANYDGLFRKYLRQAGEKGAEPRFASKEDLRQHVEFVLADPDRAVPATNQGAWLIARRDGDHRVTVLEAKSGPQQHQIISVHTMTDRQLQFKEESARRQFGNSAVLARPPAQEPAARIRDLPAPHDAVQPGDSNMDPTDDGGNTAFRRTIEIGALEGAARTRIAPDLEVADRPEHAAARAEMARRIEAVVAGMTGEAGRTRVHDQLFGRGEPVQGAMAGRIAYVAMLDEDGRARPAGELEESARHEVVHMLRRSGALGPAEWRALQARAAEWRQRYRIDQRYRAMFNHLSAADREAALDEEAVAEAFAYWRRGDLPVGGLVVRAFNIIARFLDQVRQAVRAVLGREADARDVFTLIERGAFGKQVAPAPSGRAAAAFRSEDDGTVFQVPATAEDRQRAMQGFLSRGQPIDRALRLPFDLFGGVDAKGEWKPGQRLSKAAERIITSATFSPEGRFAWLNGSIEAARAGLIDRYGLADEYVQRDRRRELDERKILLRGAEVLKTLKEQGVDVHEARVLQAMLTGEQLPEGDLAKLAAPIREAVDDLGREAVELGLVSEESYQRNRGTYLHRVYMKDEAAQSGLSRWAGQMMASRRKKIVGNQLRGRGIFMDVDAGRVLRETDAAQAARSRNQRLRQMEKRRDELMRRREVVAARLDERGAEMEVTLDRRMDVSEDAKALKRRGGATVVLKPNSYQKGQAREQGVALNRLRSKSGAAHALLQRIDSQLASVNESIVTLETRLFAADDLQAQPGQRFVVLDKLEPGKDGEAERVTHRAYVPAGQEIPAKFAGYANRGTWEVRRTGNGKVTLWRDFTKAEREKMGEILDARYTIAKTFLGMAHDLATGRFYKDVAGNAEWSRAAEDVPESRWVDADEYRRFWADPSVQWVRVPETSIPDTGGKKRWGALAGRFVRAEIWRDLNELNEMQRPSVWKTLLNQWKLNKTARSSVVHMNNVMSNIMFMDLADVRAQDLVRGIRSYLRGDRDFQDAADHGAFGSDMLSQEMRKTYLEPVLKELQGQNLDTAEGRFALVGRIAGALWGAAKAADAKMADAYRAEDEVFRMATFMRRRQLGDSPEQAARYARDQYLDYDIRAPWVNAARRTVLPFIAYTYRAVPVLARAIATRPWKLAKYFTMAYAANALAYGILGLGEEDEDRERRSMREQEQGKTWLGLPRMLRLPFQDQYDNPVFLDIRRWIPAGDVFDMNQGQSAVPIPAPLQFGGPLMLAAELALNRQGFTGKDIINGKTDDAGDKAAKLADWAWKSWMPSAAWVPGSWYWEKIDRAWSGARDVSGRPYSVPQAVASSFGIKVIPQDVEQGFEFRALEFQKVERELQLQARQFGRDLERGIIDQQQFDRQMEGILEKAGRLEKKAEETFKSRTSNRR
jgi:hypothetical protein